MYFTNIKKLLMETKMKCNLILDLTLNTYKRTLK